MKSLFSLLFGICSLSSSLALAGGGGSCPPPNSGDILICRAQESDQSANIKLMNVYHTDGCGEMQRTFVQFDIKDDDLSYIFQIANGIDSSGASVVGHHVKKSVLVFDPHEVIGYNSSGVFADVDSTVTEIAPKTFQIDGLMHITRAKNEAVNGPDFSVHGTVVCD